MKLSHALAAGFAGSVALTVAHQLLHRISGDAPRMDLMGEEAVSKITDEADIDLSESNLYKVAMGGDLLANTIYYAASIAGKEDDNTTRGTILGMVAGAGGVFLPKYLGLNNDFSDRTLKTKLMTVALYTFGGWVTGIVARKLNESRLL